MEDRIVFRKSSHEINKISVTCFTALGVAEKNNRFNGHF